MMDQFKILLACFIGAIILIGLLGTLFNMMGSTREKRARELIKRLIAEGWKEDNDGWWYHPAFPGQTYKFYVKGKNENL